MTFLYKENKHFSQEIMHFVGFCKNLFKMFLRKRGVNLCMLLLTESTQNSSKGEGSIISLTLLKNNNKSTKIFLLFSSLSDQCLPHTVPVPRIWYSNKTEIHPGTHAKTEAELHRVTRLSFETQNITKKSHNL